MKVKKINFIIFQVTLLVIGKIFQIRYQGIDVAKLRRIASENDFLGKLYIKVVSHGFKSRYSPEGTVYAPREAKKCTKLKLAYIWPRFHA